MSVFFRRATQRDLTWEDVFRGTGGPGGVSFAGRNEAALTVIPVYAAVGLIADSFAVLPLSCYRGDLGSSVRIPTPAYLDEPDRRISVFDWRFQLATSLKLRGNAYGVQIGEGDARQIAWIHPDHITVDESKHIPVYIWKGKPEYSTTEGGRIIHIREFVQAGTVKGLSPIAQFRAIYETHGAAAAYGLDWFNNSAIPASLLQAKKPLKQGQAAEAKEIFMDSARGREPVVLDSEWAWTQISVSPDEAQFLATIKATATQIAAIFRVSPEDIGGEAGNSRTYSNRESDQEVFNVRTLLPLVTRVEMALNKLLPVGEFVKFNMDVLNRPNLLERSKVYTENLKNGTQTLAEIRKLENRPELTPAQIAEWIEWYGTFKSESESSSTSSSVTQ